MAKEQKIGVRQSTKFSMIPEWLLDIGLSPGAYMVYGALAKYANNKSKETFVSHSTLADKLGVARNTIVNRVRELENKGAIIVEHRYEEGHQKSNNYLLVWDAPEFLKETEIIEVVDATQEEVEIVVEKISESSGFDIGEAESSIKKKRTVRTQPLWQPLVKVCGYDPTGNPTMSKAFAVGMREIESFGGTPEEIMLKAQAYKKRFGSDVELTPKALAKWWQALETKQPGNQAYGITALEQARQKALHEEKS